MNVMITINILINMFMNPLFSCDADTIYIIHFFFIEFGYQYLILFAPVALVFFFVKKYLMYLSFYCVLCGI